VVLEGAAANYRGSKLKSSVQTLEPDFALPTNSQVTKLEVQVATSIANSCGVVLSAEVEVISLDTEQALVAPIPFVREQPRHKNQHGAAQT